jgi:hypothetical protein
MRLQATVVACALALVASLDAATPIARAFVSPGYHSSRARRILRGRWRVLTMGQSGNGVPMKDMLVLVIDETTMRFVLLGEDKGPQAEYRILAEDDASLELDVVRHSSTGDEHTSADVLVESPDAMTVYILRKGEDKEQVLRLSRIEQ